MIEKNVLDYLNERLDVPAYMEVPAGATGEFVVIEKTGSSEADRVTSAMLAIQSYSDTMLGAAELNEAVKDAMEGLVTLPEVSAARLNSDYNFTNVNTKQYRYQAVYDITHYC